MPAWAQAAAAVLIVGVAAGIANLDIRYDANGLSIRTGWSTAAAPARTDTVANSVATTVTRAELVALEQRLRDVSAQRQADLVRIDRSLGLVENNLGVEVLKQRERVNYLLRVNQRQ